MRFKVLSLLLAILMVVSLIGVLASCGIGTEKTSETESTKKETFNPAKETAGSDETKKETETETDAKQPLTFTEAEGQMFVYVIELNYHKTADILESSVAGQLKYGDAVTRTGVSSDGEWTRIKVEDGTFYVKSKCLVEKLDVLNNLDEPEELYVTAESLNVRLIPNFEDSAVIVGVLKKGDKVVRVAISEDGTFSRIKFTPEGGKEGEYYVGNKYLSKEAPETESSKSE
ncbi:MAG: hypothetical protein IJU20_06920 [Clostridia bacterium]|nr:hypothetical protein [Clostridia bacterium]